jgi:hypothetical protein
MTDFIERFSADAVPKIRIGIRQSRIMKFEE